MQNSQIKHVVSILSAVRNLRPFVDSNQPQHIYTWEILFDFKGNAFESNFVTSSRWMILNVSFDSKAVIPELNTESSRNRFVACGESQSGTLELKGLCLRPQNYNKRSVMLFSYLPLSVHMFSGLNYWKHDSKQWVFPSAISDVRLEGTSISEHKQ